MKQNVVVLALGLVALTLSHAAAQDSLEFTLDEVDAAEAPAKGKGKPATVDTARVVEQALGGLRWGMSKADVIKSLKAAIRAEFEQRIKVERDIMRQDALYQEANEQARRLTENFISFDGPKTGWDVSPISAEFTHGNREAMLVVTRRNTREIYFFIQGKLWKWYRELSPEALGASDGSEALAALEAKFGASTGKPQQERRNDSNIAYEGRTWTAGATRVTAMQRGADTCLIFEDVRTLSNLGVLRHAVQVNGGKRGPASVIDSILLTGAEVEARNR
jgi:hypothetical protein